MAITVKDKIFNLETENTLYQMKVDRFGVLNHLWYGEKTDCCMDYLLDYPDAGFSGNIYEAENERTYSLNTLPQEYSTSGVGDFRISAISVPCSLIYLACLSCFKVFIISHHKMFLSFLLSSVSV